MGRRQANDESERRTVKVTVQLTPTERGDLDAHAVRTGLTPSEFCRRKVFSKGGKEPPAARDVMASRDLIKAINKVGVNINQLTALAQATRSNPHLQEYRPVAERLMEALAAVIRANAP